MADPSNDPEKAEIAVFLHQRALRPLMGMALLFLSLPLVLGGEGKNMFINLGLSLATSAAYYAGLFVASVPGRQRRALADRRRLVAALVAFGTLAAARWDTIRT